MKTKEAGQSKKKKDVKKTVVRIVCLLLAVLMLAGAMYFTLSLIFDTI